MRVGEGVELAVAVVGLGIGMERVEVAADPGVTVDGDWQAVSRISPRIESFFIAPVA